MNNTISSVELRSIYEEDATVLMELNNDDEISHYVVGSPKKITFEQQLLWMKNLKNETNTVRWMILFEGKAVGTIIVSSIDHINGIGHIGIKLLPKYHARGIAKAALLKACDLAFDDLNLFCLTANILPYNSASCGLFKSVGFQQDGVLRSHVVKSGLRYDLLTFSYLKSERIKRDYA